ncbi:MAG: GNAT family N-acetyltransferase [Caulobacterales bacterium]|jgi:predicted GNAT superfamily acetyltransferase
MSPSLRPYTEADLDWMHPLNQRFATELSSETPESFAVRALRACVALVAPPDRGFLLAFDQEPAQGAIHFGWLSKNSADFIYVDRIVTAPHARGQGLARAFYEALFDIARGRSAKRITCEVNLSPPNPTSDAFHAAMGFTEIGRNDLPKGKIVRYLAREL